MRDPRCIRIPPPLRCSLCRDERGQHLGLVLNQEERDRLSALRAADYELVALGRDCKPGVAGAAQQHQPVHTSSSSRITASRSVTPLHPAEMLAFLVFSSVTSTASVTDDGGTKPAELLGCDGVTDRGGRYRAKASSKCSCL